MSNVCAIVTPIHSNQLDDKQTKRLRISLEYNSDLKHIFVVPNSLITSNLSFQFPKSDFYRFDDYHFYSYRAYNHLMLSPMFYSRFLDFEKILILQTDAILIRDINPILDMNFSYLGAPWEPSYRLIEFLGRLFLDRDKFPFGRKYVIDSGNGGLSLRNVKYLLNLLTSWQKEKSKLSRILNYENRFNEDILISFLIQRFGDLTVTREVASLFFAERIAEDSFDGATRNLFGFHALGRYAPSLEEKLLRNFRI